MLTNEETNEEQKENPEGENLPPTDLSKYGSLEDLKAAANKFRLRHGSNPEPANDEVKKYWEQVNVATPTVNPTSIEDFVKNLNSLNYGKKIKRPQILDYETAKKLFRVIALKLTAGKYEYNQYNKDVIRESLKWFIADPSCEMDLTKGICYVGNVGTGKSKLFEIFQVMMESFYKEEIKFKIKLCKDIVAETKDMSSLKRYYGGQVMFDDLGMEVNDVKLYGNSVAVMSDIIFQRELSHERNGLITHFTTNLIPEPDPRFPDMPSLESKYGDRIFDRLQKMCNIVFIEQDFSFRKNK